jgi:hypothetical protein
MNGGSKQQHISSQKELLKPRLHTRMQAVVVLYSRTVREVAMNRKNRVVQVLSIG